MPFFERNRYPYKEYELCHVLEQIIPLILEG